MPGLGARDGWTRFALAIGLLIVVAGVLFFALRGDEEHGPRDGFFGVNAPLLRDYALDPDDGRLDALAASMEDAGIEWARFSFDQNVEERQPSQFDWSLPDRVIAALARHRVRAQALFVGTAYWAADPAVVPICGTRSFPSDVKGWSRFVGAAVARYGPGGDFWSENPDLPELPIEVWEIGNEENLRIFWCPAANPEQYARVYSAAREAALAEDPDAQVIVGGLAPVFSPNAPSGDLDVPAFLQRLLAADPSLASDIPAVAIHPYAQTPKEVFEVVGLFRETMRRVGLGDTPLIVNEVGWYTSGAPGPLLTTDAERASRIEELASGSWRTNCDLLAFGVHAWVTAQVDPNNHEDWYGLADPSTGAPNESGRAYGHQIGAIRSGESSDPGRSSRTACG